VWASGKSFGGRMASMAVAEGMPAAGLVFLGYPLHPPGKPERIRDEHLYRIEAPMLFLHGTNDPFASGGLLAEVARKLGDRATIEEIEGGDHSFNVRGRRTDPREVGAGLAELAAPFVRRVAGDA
jgi:predicted alpha/beta-hydrolase family hydrolase